MRGHRILITGGAGFIGNRLVRELVQDNEVLCMDSYVRTGSESTAPPRVPGATYMQADVRNADQLSIAMANRDLVIHAAGIAGIDTVGRSPATTLSVNAQGTLAVLDAALKAGVSGRVICFSTSEIFGAHAYDVRESSPAVVGAVGEPRWTYAASKLMSEHLAFAYWREFELPTVVVRPFNIYGPGQLGEGAVRNFVHRALRGEDLVIRGTGNQIRSWCFVDDFVRGVLACAESSMAVGDTFNIGNSREVCTTLELARRIAQVTRSQSEIRHVDALPADVMVRIPNTDKARDLLGFEARISLDEGLAATVAHMSGVQ